eukprot:9488659-Pyramimonas_sp.AAC.1
MLQDPLTRPPSCEGRWSGNAGIEPMDEAIPWPAPIGSHPAPSPLQRRSQERWRAFSANKGGVNRKALSPPREDSSSSSSSSSSTGSDSE